MFDLGIQELIVVFIVALIVFGPKRLPELGRSLGKGLLELRKAVQGIKEQIDAGTGINPDIPGGRHAVPENEKNANAKETKDKPSSGLQRKEGQVNDR